MQQEAKSFLYSCQLTKAVDDLIVSLRRSGVRSLQWLTPSAKAAILAPDITRIGDYLHAFRRFRVLISNSKAEIHAGLWGMLTNKQVSFAINSAA